MWTCLASDQLEGASVPGNIMTRLRTDIERAIDGYSPDVHINFETAIEGYRRLPATTTRKTMANALIILMRSPGPPRPDDPRIFLLVAALKHMEGVYQYFETSRLSPDGSDEKQKAVINYRGSVRRIQSIASAMRANNEILRTTVTAFMTFYSWLRAPREAVSPAIERARGVLNDIALFVASDISNPERIRTYNRACIALIEAVRGENSDRIDTLGQYFSQIKWLIGPYADQAYAAIVRIIDKA